MSKTKEIENLQVALGMDIQSFSKEISNAKKSVRNLSKDFELASKSIDYAENKVDAYTSAIEKGNKALLAMDKKLKLQEKQYDDLAETIKRQAKESDELATKLKQEEKALEELSKTYKKSSDEYKEQEKVVKELQKALKDKVELIDKNKNKFQQYSVEINKTKYDIDKLKNSINNLETSLKDLDNNGKETFENLKNTSNNAESSFASLALGAKGAAVAVASIFSKMAYDGAIAYDDAILSLRLSLGLAEKDAKKLYDRINDIAGDGGYSLEGVSNAVTLLEKRFNLSNEETKDLAQSLDLLNKMGYETNSVVRFMTSAVNDWGMSHNEALDMIMAGEQEGLNIADDWLDTLTEYTPILSSMGINGQQAFALIAEAMTTTGLTSDNSADMIKEFFLTITDGSDATGQALMDLGLDVDSLKNQIDDGSISAFDAFKKVTDAVSNVSSETERSRLMAEVFKGTWEYGTDRIVENWAEVDETIYNMTGTMEEAKKAYEDSYSAMQQDLSNEWNELKQTIGKGVIPILTKVTSDTIDVIKGLGVLPKFLANDLKQASLNIGNAFDGAYGKILEIQKNAKSEMANIAEKSGFGKLANSIRDDIEEIDKKHKKVVDNIRKREKENAEIIKQEDKILSNLFKDNKKAKVEVDTKEATKNISKINNDIKELPDDEYIIIDAETDKSKDKVKEVKEEIKDFPKEQKVEVKADVSDSKEKVKEVNKELETVEDKNSTVVFHAETAQASKNVTGLKKNIADYDSKNTNKTKKTNFHTETAQASKNVTGLKNNIKDYVNKFAKTFTTTFNVVTNHKTIGAPNSTPKAPKVIPRETLVSSARNVATQYISPKNSLENNRDVNTINTKESINNINANSSNLDNTLKSSRRNKDNFMDYFYNDISPLENLEDKLKDINNQLDILDKKSESAFGDNKVNALKNQASLLEKQKNIQKDLIEEAKAYQNELKYFLGKNNIKLDSNGDILSKQEKLLNIEKQINSLRNSSSNAKDKEKESIENKISSLEKLKKAIEEYSSITNDKIPNATKEWLDLESKIKDTQSAILDAIDAQENFKVNLNIQSLEQDIEDLTNNINLLDNHIERAFGEDKVKLIEKKSNALKEQQKELNKLANTYREQAKDIANLLNNQGFVIEKDGYIGNLQHLEKLQNSPIFDNINKKLEEYVDLTNNKIPSLQDDWWNLQSSIEGCKDEIKELNDANFKAIESSKDLVEELKNQYLEFNIDEIQDEILRLDREISNTTSINKKIDLYNEKISLINKEQEEVKKIISLYEKQADVHKNLLSSKGFKFNSNGLITNLEHLEKLVNDNAFEDIKEALNEYADLTTSTIPNLKDEWEELESSIADCNDEINKVIKDTLNEKLEITSKIEDKITEKYKDDIQDRIDLINKEKNAEIKALKEKQDAYNNSRDEQKYQDNYDDQLKKVMDIQKQLDILAKDNSLSGQKKHKELLEKLEEEQKALEDLVQDKIDQDVNNMFDKESDRITESAESSIKDLEDKFSDSKIAEMVAGALGSGVFKDIEGNVISLENALIDFSKESGELFGVLGSTIEKELIENLQVAVDTFKDLDNILQTLNSNSSKFSIPDVDYSSARYAPSQGRSIKSNTNNNVSVNFNQPLVSINGNVDKEVMPDFKKAILELRNDITNIVVNEIYKKLN